jgi:protein ImuA
MGNRCRGFLHLLSASAERGRRFFAGFCFSSESRLTQYDTFVELLWMRMLASGAGGLGAMTNVSQSEDANLSRPDAREQLVSGLRRQLGRWEAAGGAEDAVVFSSGAAAVDRLLPSGGLRHGMLVEWLTGADGAIGGGAATLGLLGAREACADAGALVVIDRQQTFYPPAAAAWGIDLDRVIVVHPQNARDELWAAVQALRSPAVAAIWAVIDRLDSRAFRRLQLAAQAGRTLGVLMRPGSARGEPSWADVSLEVETRVKSPESRARIPALDSRLLTLGFHRRVQVHVLRCHNGRAGGSAVLEIDDTAYAVQEAAEGYRLSAIGYRPGLLANSR